MAMPPHIQVQVIKKRLKGKEGKAKLAEIKQIERELPGFNQGHYGEIKKWLKEEARKTTTRSKIKHQDWLGVKKQGIRQFVLVGCPNIGKSSLLKNLCGLQTKVANYEFTTLKPIPGMVNIHGAEFQLVDLPGLVEGATENVGQGKRLVGIVRTADGILLMHDLSKPLEQVEVIVKELMKAGIEKKLIVIGSKVDLSREQLVHLQQRFTSVKVIALSNETGEGIDSIKNALWEISNLIRVYPKHQPKALILDKGSTVKTFALKIHRDLVAKVKYARVTGKSVKFANQQVGLHHVLFDGDVIELILEK